MQTNPRDFQEEPHWLTFAFLLGIVGSIIMATLKLGGLITFSWFWVLLPIVSVAIVLTSIIAMLMLMALSFDCRSIEEDFYEDIIEPEYENI